MFCNLALLVDCFACDIAILSHETVAMQQGKNNNNHQPVATSGQLLFSFYFTMWHFYVSGTTSDSFS